eukprot:SAG31_NODE_1366_length_8621_cov_4.579911_9_plen_64_part_00
MAWYARVHVGTTARGRRGRRARAAARSQAPRPGPAAGNAELKLAHTRWTVRRDAAPAAEFGFA